MSHDTSAGDPTTPPTAGPSFAAPGQPAAAPPAATAPSAPSGPPPAGCWSQDGFVATPALPAERVGRGAALALLAVPAGALVAGVVGAFGFIATLSAFVTANLFYPPVLGEAAKPLAMLVVFSVVGGVTTIARVVRAGHQR